MYRWLKLHFEDLPTCLRSLAPCLPSASLHVAFAGLGFSLLVSVCLPCGQHLLASSVLLVFSFHVSGRCRVPALPFSLVAPFLGLVQSDFDGLRVRSLNPVGSVARTARHVGGSRRSGSAARTFDPRHIRCVGFCAACLALVSSCLRVCSCWLASCSIGGSITWNIYPPLRQAPSTTLTTTIDPATSPARRLRCCRDSPDSDKPRLYFEAFRTTAPTRCLFVPVPRGAFEPTSLVSLVNRRVFLLGVPRLRPRTPSCSQLQLDRSCRAADWS